MVSILIGIIPRLLLSITSIYFVYRSLQLFNKFSTRSVAIITVIYSTIVVGGILQLYSYSFGLEAATAINSSIDGYIGVFFVYLLILMTSFYEGTQFNSLKIIIATSFATVVIISIAMTSQLQQISGDIALFSLVFIPYFIWGTYSIYRSLKRMETNMSGKQLEVVRLIKIFLIVGILGISSFYAVFAVISPIFGDSGNINQLFYILQPIIPSLLFIFSNYLFYISFIKPKNPALLQPQYAEKFILMTPEGTPIFDYNFKSTISIDGVLLSGALTAITAVLKEATQVAGDLESVKIGGKTIIIKVHDQMIGTLFTDQLTDFTIDALDQTMQEISLMELNNISLEPDEIEQITVILETNFGYR